MIERNYPDEPTRLGIYRERAMRPRSVVQRAKDAAVTFVVYLALAVFLWCSVGGLIGFARYFCHDLAALCRFVWGLVV